MLDGIVRRGGHLVRRGRWFLTLANATLRWQVTPQNKVSERTLLIQDGHIRCAAGLSAEKRQGRASSDPSQMARRQIFTSATYNRLRVLTTELRRLLGTQRCVHLRPAIGGAMDRKGLQRLLDLI